MNSRHIKFGRSLLSLGNLGWEFLVMKFRYRKTGLGNLGHEISVPIIPFELTPSDHMEEWIAHVKMVCAQYENIPPAQAGR